MEIDFIDFVIEGIGILFCGFVPLALLFLPFFEHKKRNEKNEERNRTIIENQNEELTKK